MYRHLGAKKSFLMNRTILLSFLALLITLSFKGTALGGVPITALLLEFEKLKTQIEESQVDQELKERVLELWLLAQTVALSPNHSTPIKLKQLEVLKCALLDFPEEERGEAVTTVGGIGALLAEGSKAPDKPVKRDLPEVATPVAACKVEILRLNTDSDVFEVAPVDTTLDGPYRTVFLSARASEPGSFEWFEDVLFDNRFLNPSNPTALLEFPLPFKGIPSPFFSHRTVSAVETGNGVLQLSLTPEKSSELESKPHGRYEVARIRVVFTSEDGQRMCEDTITATWNR